MPQELSVDRIKPLGISTLDNYAQWGCISRTAPYRSQCVVLCNRSYTLTRHTRQFYLVCCVMGYTHHTVFDWSCLVCKCDYPTLFLIGRVLCVVLSVSAVVYKALRIGPI